MREPTLVRLDDWHRDYGNGPICVRPGAEFIRWLRDEPKHPWRWTDDNLHLLFDDFLDAALFTLRWL